MARARIALLLTAVLVGAATACGSGQPSPPGASAGGGTSSRPASPTSTAAPGPATTPPPPTTHGNTAAPPTTARPPAATATPPKPPTIAPPAVDPALAGRDWTRIPTGNRVVALTFDAGANAAGVTSILATLRAAGVPATFYLTGRFAGSFPASSRSIAAAGHRLGNHSVDHPDFTTLSDAQIRSQVLTATSTIVSVTGRSPSPLFRFPFGAANARTIAAVNAAGYVPVRWTVDTLGWKGTSGGQSTSTVLARVLAGLTPGEIVLMHVGGNPDDGSTLDADALPAVISALRHRGYGFVTLDALLTR